MTKPATSFPSHDPKVFFNRQIRISKICCANLGPLEITFDFENKTSLLDERFISGAFSFLQKIYNRNGYRIYVDFMTGEKLSSVANIDITYWSVFSSSRRIGDGLKGVWLWPATISLY